MNSISQQHNGWARCAMWRLTDLKWSCLANILRSTEPTIVKLVLSPNQTKAKKKSSIVVSGSPADILTFPFWWPKQKPFSPKICRKSPIKPIHHFCFAWICGNLIESPAIELVPKGAIWQFMSNRHSSPEMTRIFSVAHAHTHFADFQPKKTSKKKEIRLLNFTGGKALELANTFHRNRNLKSHSNCERQTRSSSHSSAAPSTRLSAV